jgi:hypothetical protein
MNVKVLPAAQYSFPLVSYEFPHPYRTISPHLLKTCGRVAYAFCSYLCEGTVSHHQPVSAHMWGLDSNTFRSCMPLIDMSIVVRLDSMSSRAELTPVEPHVASGVLPKLS